MAKNGSVFVGKDKYITKIPSLVGFFNKPQLLKLSVNG